MNVPNALDFLSWAYEKTELNSGQVDKVLTAVASVLKDKGETFDRKKYPTIKRHLDGYRDQRPPISRKKMPFCRSLIILIFKYCINTNDITDVLAGIGLLLGHDTGLRPGEYTFKKKSAKKYYISVMFHSFPMPDLQKKYPLEFLIPKRINIIIVLRWSFPIVNVLTVVSDI